MAFKILSLVTELDANLFAGILPANLSCVILPANLSFVMPPFNFTFVMLPSLIFETVIALSLICKVSIESAVILANEIVFAEILSPVIIELGIWLVDKKLAAILLLVILPSPYFELVILPSSIVADVIALLSILTVVTALVSNLEVDTLLLTILSTLTEPAANFDPVILPSDICAVVIALRFMGWVTVNKSKVVECWFNLVIKSFVVLPGLPIARAISLSVSNVFGAPPIRLSIAAFNSVVVTASFPDVT